MICIGMKNTLLRLLFMVFIFHVAVMVFPLEASNYYVSPTGNDLNPGTITQPWRTIQKAANTMVAGDTVYIRSGTYREQVKPLNSGAPGNYITYTFYPGESATIDGATVVLPAGEGIFDILNISYVRIQGLRIRNAGPNLDNAGIRIKDSQNIIVENNYTYNTVSSGIGVVAGQNIIISGNEVELACNDGIKECISVALTNTFEIRNNNVHHSGPATRGGEGIDVKDGSFNGKVYNNNVHHLNRLGIYVDSWNKHTYNIEVYQNIVHDIPKSDAFAIAAEAGGLLENVSIYNNLAFNNGSNGISIARYGTAPLQPLRNITIVNNTFYKNGLNWGGCVGFKNKDVENIIFRNNICSQNVSFQILVKPGLPMTQLSIDHNLIDGFRGYTDEIYGTSYVVGDPLFVNPAIANFRLRPTSPAIDTGSPLNAPSTDFEGYSRPQGSGYDIGAHEYSLDVSLVTNVIFMFIMLSLFILFYGILTG